jgi:outer membrane protein assembly factor BamB
MRIRCLSLLRLTPVALVLCAATAFSADLVGWRGDGTGRFPSATPPTTWAKDQGVVWSTPMPGTSNSGPVIVGDRLFICSEPTTLLCVNLADGRILWQEANTYEEVLSAEQVAQMNADKAAAEPIVAQIKTATDELNKAKDAAAKNPNDAELKANVTAAQQKLDDLNKQLQPLLRYAWPPTHPWNGYSSATPVSDGQSVWVSFGTGVVACYDLEGKRKWARLVEKPNHPWGVSSSPVLAGDRLLVNFLNCVALNPATGETMWTAPTGMYWGTPIITRIADTPVAFTPFGQVLRLSDGKVLQQNLFRLDYNSPILEGDTVYYFQIPGSHSLAGQAFKLPAEAAEALQIKPTWQGRDERFYDSPVLNEGLLYCANQLDTLVCADAGNGQAVYYKKLGLGGQVFSSLCFAGGYLYITSDNGNTVVIKPGRAYEEVARNSLGDTVRSCPAFAGSRMYVRGYKKLWCIGPA